MRFFATFSDAQLHVPTSNLSNDRRNIQRDVLLKYFWVCVVGLFSTGLINAQQPELGDCTERPTIIQDVLYVDHLRWCVEGIVHESAIEPMAFTALEVAPDGTLYTTRPLTGLVMVIRDTNDDFFPDMMETFATDLTLPNGLVYHDNMLYVSGGANIYRIDMAGVVEIVVDDLPAGDGFWTGDITIGDDNRLVVAIGAPCEDCEFDPSERGMILSMALDGSDRQTIATGFRNPADVEFYRGALWTLDTSPRKHDSGILDELNQVEIGGWYGFPYCLGNDTVNILSDDITCEDAVRPHILFGSSATPRSLAAYPYDTLPGTEDTLIIVLSGEPTQVDFNGYKVVMVNFDADNQPLGLTLLVPFRKDSGKQAFEPYTEEGYRARHIITLSEQGWGLYPQQPLAVAVNSRGWIYLSITGGRIVALRPVDKLLERDNIYPIWTPMNPNYSPDNPQK
jgi:glucose/arabinose dehydrogenase